MNADAKEFDAAHPGLKHRSYAATPWLRVPTPVVNSTPSRNRNISAAALFQGGGSLTYEHTKRSRRLASSWALRISKLQSL